VRPLSISVFPARFDTCSFVASDDGRACSGIRELKLSVCSSVKDNEVMTTTVSLEQYLATDYKPDVDYVDGEIEERNVGEFDHARLQGLIYAYLFSHEKHWQVFVVPEQRIQVSPTRFRVPDIAVLRFRPKTGIVTDPPLVCVEILSPEDTARGLEARIADYLNFRVPAVWVIDPEDRRAWEYTPEGRREAKDGVLTAGGIRLPLAELGE
jgi:Uma2 family endonuclease